MFIRAEAWMCFIAPLTGCFIIIGRRIFQEERGRARAAGAPSLDE